MMFVVIEWIDKHNW